MASIGEKIKDLRIKNNLSQNDLAVSLGIKRHTISAYEIGSITPPIDKLILISKKYGVSIDYLCGISDNPIINTTKLDDSIGLDTYCLSKIEQLKSSNDLELLSCLLKYGDIKLFRNAKQYLSKKYTDDSKQKIDEYILIESIKESLNKYKNTTK